MTRGDGPRPGQLESQDDVGYLTGWHKAEDVARQIRTPGRVAGAPQAQLARKGDERTREA